MKCVFVLGMHRSGTSVLSACMNKVFGYSLGKTVLGTKSENSSGYFENNNVVAINDIILSQMGLSWASYGGNADLFNQVKDSVRPTVEKIFTDEFTGDKIVIKDPRMCAMLPLWKDVVSDAGYAIQYLLAVRNPYEVEMSLSKRLSETLGHRGVEMWFWKNEAAVANADECLVVPYEDMLGETDKTIGRIAEYIDETPKDQQSFIDGFLDKKLKHHTSEKQSKLYNRLKQMDTISDWSEVNESIHNTNTNTK